MIDKNLHLLATRFYRRDSVMTFFFATYTPRLGDPISIVDSLSLAGFCNCFRLFCGCKVVKDETGLFEAEAFGEIQTKGLGVNSTFDSWSSKLMSALSTVL